MKDYIKELPPIVHRFINSLNAKIGNMLEENYVKSNNFVQLEEVFDNQYIVRIHKINDDSLILELIHRCSMVSTFYKIN